MMKITSQTRLPITIIISLLLVGLGCSAGTFLVRAPLPTPTPTKTPRSTFTPTLIPTDSPTPTDTPTWTPAPTNTETPIPTETPTEPKPEDTPTPQPEAPTNTPRPAPPTQPPPPTNTPEPTATPVPSYPYPAVVTTHPTGGEIEFRITGFVWEGTAAGIGEAKQGFIMEVVTPSGEVKTSEVSVGPRAGASTVMGAGDNHSMNFQFKTAPYVPGVYKVTLKKDGVQMANTIDVTAQAGPPFTYAHIDFILQK